MCVRCAGISQNIRKEMPDLANSAFRFVRQIDLSSPIELLGFNRSSEFHVGTIDLDSIRPTVPVINSHWHDVTFVLLVYLRPNETSVGAITSRFTRIEGGYVVQTIVR